MKQILDDKELIVLECIASSEEPIGSWLLVELLEERSVNTSSATIGRILNRLERVGYVEKESVKGRVITQKGLEAIRNAKTIEKINFHKNELDKMINTKVLEDFIMVLQARKAIERETARLAAQHSTDQEIEYMASILRRQEDHFTNHSSIAQDDIDFHKAIAKASRNTVLESLYTIISTMGQQSKLFEHVRTQVKSPYSKSHRDILNAIKNHDADEAERCMIQHTENLIQDVTMYWDEYAIEGHANIDGGRQNE
ncbi:DNA-binding FadR family transcriptional regulator [Anaerosolibacter carboniphilus]|uniref:DNA-binding FadR family transcriptional regulator n=1 Tax=Anaerosolibacter carboniphilus TaxID=1417629 RepID=A0A841L1L8_9FIRM|nr:FCD domain-containing protein [Anaerosolibacter carboniphilus]MBB6217062.1 DNA-binding FadR family transcriptional regulator [Anaerosolibacter carboniphilus]